MIAWSAAALCCGCGIKQATYDAAGAQLDQARQELDSTRRSIADGRRSCDEKQSEIEAQNLKLKERLTGMGQDISTRSTDLESAKKRMAELQKAQEAAEKRAAQFRMMVDKFKSMISAGKLQVEIRDGRMLVKLPDNILFDPGKTALKKPGQDALAQVAQILSTIEGRKFQVAGHTDNQPIKKGKFKSNWELSTQRAVEVVRFMGSHGMALSRLSAAGYADTAPVAANDSDAGRRKNRRIEIVVVPDLEDLPLADAPKS